MTAHPKIASFIEKLHSLICDNNDQIVWGPAGDSFVINDPIEFSKSLLVENFKHSNIASFVRQLNKYDFRKLKTPKGNDQIAAWEFQHPNFHRDSDSWLSIKRKAASSKSADPPDSDEVGMKSRVRELEVTQNMLLSTVDALTAQVEMLSDEVKRLTHRVPSHHMGSMPRSPVKLQQLSPIRSAPIQEKSHILIVEDNPVCCEITKRMLDIMGHTFTVARDGYEALEQMKHLPRFNAILMDIHMPTMSGMDTAYHIREFDQHTPIIAVTVCADEKDFKIYSSHGMQGMLKKPFSIGALDNVLKRWCHSRQQQPAKRPIAESQQAGLAHPSYEPASKIGRI